MLAYCGLECDTCPIHLATLEQEPARKRELKESIAEESFRVYGVAILPEDINDCDGCRAAGRLFTGCHECGIRNCAEQKGIQNCAFCGDYACEMVKDLFNHDPGAEIRLNSIRETIRLSMH